MSTQTITKPECQTCGRKIPTSGARNSSIKFRKHVNAIDTLDDVLRSRDYFARYIKNKFRLKEYVNNFLTELEKLTDDYDSTNSTRDLEQIRIWIFSHINDLSNRCDVTNPEDSVYNFLRTNYSDINETFHEFYNNYSYWHDNPLNGNHISRALSALGLKTIMKKIKHDGKPKCAMVLSATKDELSEIFRKNGY